MSVATVDRALDTRPGPDRSAELRQMEMRLEEGYRRIEHAATNGADVSKWNAVWLRLLDDYEQLYRELAA